MKTLNSVRTELIFPKTDVLCIYKKKKKEDAPRNIAADRGKILKHQITDDNTYQIKEFI